MADQAVKIPVELEIRNLEEMVRKASQGLAGAQLEAGSSGNDQRGNMEKLYDMMNTISNRFRGIASDEATKGQKAGIALLGQASDSSGKIGDDIMKLMKTGIGIIEDIHTKLKQSSPLLQSVENLFNLAVQLFFMPLGNKLATVMLPAIMDLVDGVLGMWDEIEGLDLGDMLTKMIEYGARLFGQFFENLGEKLSEQGGLLGSIGSILEAVGDFIENRLGSFLQTMLNLLETIMSNLGTLAIAFIEFKMLSVALQVAQIAATVAAGTKIGSLTAGVAIAAGATTMAVGNAALFGSGVGEEILNMNAASGAYVGAVEGGRSVTVAEGGEGEFILPEGRMESILSGVISRAMDRTPEVQAPEAYDDARIVGLLTSIEAKIPSADEGRAAETDDRMYDLVAAIESDVSAIDIPEFPEFPDITVDVPEQTFEAYDDTAVLAALSDIGSRMPADTVTAPQADDDRMYDLVATIGDLISDIEFPDITVDVPTQTAGSTEVTVDLEDDLFTMLGDISSSLDTIARISPSVSVEMPAQTAAPATVMISDIREPATDTQSAESRDDRVVTLLELISSRMVETPRAQPQAQPVQQSEPSVINNYYNTFNGYHDDDIIEIVRREVSDQISYSRLRGGL